MKVIINNQKYEIKNKVTIDEALREIGIDIFTPCKIGACYNCEVIVNGNLSRACITKIENNMEINTNLPQDYIPRRIIHGPQPHYVGGKATPYYLKGYNRYIEVAIWAAGCNLLCPQCQNYAITHDNKSVPLTPYQAAEKVTFTRLKYKVDRMAISGGEPTLNRRWLIEYFKELKKLNTDSAARLHLDSNGTLLTSDYIDELITAGVTDIGIEPKGISISTFSKITAINDNNLIRKYLENAWYAIEYIIKNYKDKVFLGVGLPYNNKLISIDEVAQFGKKLATLDKNIQLCVLDYFPIFKRYDIIRPTVDEMLRIKEILNKQGLNIVIVQTIAGHIGP